MTNSAIAARIINALEAAAAREAETDATMVSVTIEMLARADAGMIDVRLVRKTRTLVFLSAEFVADGGARIAAASAVFKVNAPP